MVLVIGSSHSALCLECLIRKGGERRGHGHTQDPSYCMQLDMVT